MPVMIWKVLITILMLVNFAKIELSYSNRVIDNCENGDRPSLSNPQYMNEE